MTDKELIARLREDALREAAAVADNKMDSHIAIRDAILTLIGEHK